MTNKQLKEQSKSLQHFIEIRVIPFEHLTCFKWMRETLQMEFQIRQKLVCFISLFVIGI